MSIQAINRGIYERMANDEDLTSLISIYKGSPSIFTIDPVPTDVNFPFITASEDFSSIPFDTKTLEGREVNRFIRVFTESSSGSRILLDRISERVRFLFHRKHLEISIDGFQVIISNMQGPEFLATDEYVFGDEFQLRLVLQNFNC